MADLASPASPRRRHQLDREPAHGDRAPEHDAASGYRQTAVTAQQTALKDVAAKLAALQNAATGARRRRDLEADPDRRVLGHEASPSRTTGGAGIGGRTDPGRPARRPRCSAASPSTGDGRHAHVAYAAATASSSWSTVAAGATIQQSPTRSTPRRPAPSSPRWSRTAVGEDRLVLSSRMTGSTSDFTVTGGGVLTDDTAYTTPDLAQLNAAYTLDGGAQPPSQTNVLENAVPGLRITLKARHRGRRPPSRSPSPRSTATASRRSSRPSSTPTTPSSTPRARS